MSFVSQARVFLSLFPFSLSLFFNSCFFFFGGERHNRQLGNTGVCQNSLEEALAMTSLEKDL